VDPTEPFFCVLWGVDQLLWLYCDHSNRRLLGVIQLFFSDAYKIEMVVKDGGRKVYA
jgi:hypothetical protein